MTTSSSEPNSSFVHRRIVRFGECDPAGVAYYPVFFNWFHQAMEACFEEFIGEPYAQVIRTVGFPAVHTETQFQRPLAVGEHIQVAVSIASLGTSSVTWRFDIFNASGQIAAVGRVKTVCIAVTEGEFKFASVPVPETIRSALQGLLSESLSG